MLFIWIASTCLLCQIAYSLGGTKVREGIITANPTQIQEISKSIGLSDSILQSLITDQSTFRDECEKDIMFWRNSYFYIKQQNENNIEGESIID